MQIKRQSSRHWNHGHFVITQHCNSTDIEDEEFLIGCNKLIGIMKMLRDNDLIQSPEEFKEYKINFDIESKNHIER